MKKTILAAAILAATQGWAATEEEVAIWPKAADDAVAAKWTLGENGRWIEQDGEMVLEVTSAKRTLDSSGVSFPLDLDMVRGKSLRLSAEVQTENITKPEPWIDYLGAKLVLFHGSNSFTKHPEPKAVWQRRYGTHDWFPATVEVMRLPDDLNRAAVSVGIQGATGTVRYRRMRLTATADTSYSPELPDGFKCEYTEKCKALPRLRGVMSPPVFRITEQDVRDLAKWGANAIRWQFAPNTDLTKEADYAQAYRDTWKRAITKLETLLPVFEECGIKVIIDMHAPPYGRVGKIKVLGTAGIEASAENNPAVSSAFRLAFEDEAYALYLKCWEAIAKRFKGNETVVAYDLLNEPDQQTPVKYDYLQMQEEAARRIRAIDAEKPVIVTVNEWARCPSFSYLKPIPVKNVFYTFHMYEPGHYTHQGAGDNFAKQRRGEFLRYPGEWGREWLRQQMRPARDFQTKWGARIYVGEFGVLRFAPGAAQWLDDVISLFEEAGWDWTFHAYREWYNWSAEHSADFHDLKPATTPTDRLKVLMKWMRRNVR